MGYEGDYSQKTPLAGKEIRLKIDVRHLLAEVTPETLPVSDADPFEAIVGWDSLKMINLVVRLEQLLGRELSEAELENLRTIRDLDALLKLN